MKTITHPASQLLNLKQGVASKVGRMYRPPVVTLLATGPRNPSKSRRTSAQITTAGVFFCQQLSFMAAVCGMASALPVSLIPGIPSPCTVATQSPRKDGSGSQNQGASPLHTLIPSKIRALAQRRMALSALRADSSISTRLKRYSHHMAIVRTLETVGGAV